MRKKNATEKKKKSRKRGGLRPYSFAAVASAEDNTPPPSEDATDPSGEEESEKVVDSGDSSLKPLGAEESESRDETAVGINMEYAIEQPMNLDSVVGEEEEEACPSLNAQAREAEKTVESESGSGSNGKIVLEEGEEKVTMTLAGLEGVEEAIGEEKTENGACLILVDKGDGFEEELKKVHNGGENEGDAVETGPQMIVMDAGGEDNCVVRKTPVGEIEEITEIEEMEVLGIRDTLDAKDVDDTVGEGEVSGFRADEEKDNKEENQKDIVKDISEDSDGDSKEDDDLCKYTYDFLTNYRKQKNIEIFVGGIGKGTAEEDLINVFGKFGELKSTRIVKHQTTKKSKGFAFIQYATLEQSKNVLSQLKDGIEVRGNLVKISASEEKDTLFMGNICKKWSKEHVSETLRGYGIEQIVHIHLPEDDTKEGRIKGFALLEFNSHSDALSALQRLIKLDAVFGRNIRAKVSFAQVPILPSEEAPSKVESNLAKPHLRDQLQKQGTRGGFKVKYDGGKLVKAGSFKEKARSLKKKGRSLKEKAGSSKEKAGSLKEKDGSFKEKGGSSKEKDGSFKEKAGSSKEKDRSFKKKAGSSKEKGELSVVEARSSKKNDLVNNKGKSNESNISQGHDIGTSSKQEKKNRKRKNLATWADDGHGEKDNSHGYDRKSKRQLRGNNNLQGRQNNTFRNPRSYPRLRDGPFSGASSVSYGNQYAWKHATPSFSNYPFRSYTPISRAKIHHTDMEPHAGYLEPTVGQQGQPHAGLREPVHRIRGLPHDADYLNPVVGVLSNHRNDYRMSASGYDDQGSREPPYVVGSGSGHRQSYVANYTGRIAYEAGDHYQYRNTAYPPGRAHSFAKRH